MLSTVCCQSPVPGTGQSLTEATASPFLRALRPRARVIVRLATPLRLVTPLGLASPLGLATPFRRQVLFPLSLGIHPCLLCASLLVLAPPPPPLRAGLR